MLTSQVSIQVDGLTKLDSQLKMLLNDVQQASTLRAALRAGGKVLVDSMRSRVKRTAGQPHHASGKPRPHVADDLKVRFKRDNGLLTAHIGAGRQTAYIANFLERTGAAPHEIKAKPGRALNVKGRLVESVQHPGMQPSPFIRPAFDSQKDRAIEQFKTVLADRIRREIGKI